MRFLDEWRFVFAVISVFAARSLRSRLSCSALLAARRCRSGARCPYPARSSACAAACAHRDAGAHDAHARERGKIGVDAAAGRDDVVGFDRRHAAERNVVRVIFRECLPDIAGAVIVQFDRPGGAADGVVELRAVAHFVERELVAAHDPAGLADAGIAIGAHARIAEARREFVLEKLRLRGRPAPCLRAGSCAAASGSSGVSVWVMLSTAMPRPGMTNDTGLVRMRSYFSAFSFMRSGESRRAPDARPRRCFRARPSACRRPAAPPTRGTASPASQVSVASPDASTKPVAVTLHVAVARREIDVLHAPAVRC